MKNFVKEQEKSSLRSWYLENSRPLPWRSTQDPYKIWISETMLQQTTSTAVIPYYKRFLKSFPSLALLAKASESDVLQLWTGLGYTSRAKNLLKAAKILTKLDEFPRSAEELIELPGFGPYTSRSVSSLAFGEATGVLDGNVIRVLSRKCGLSLEWWRAGPRRQLQAIADQCVANFPSADMNQAMMELGNQICQPSSPKCILCPWKTSCVAYKKGLAGLLPLKKPKREQESWRWQACVVTKGSKILLVRNNYAPFLKGQWILPGEALKLRISPKIVSFTHTITHHKIYCVIKDTSLKSWKDKIEQTLAARTETLWVDGDKVGGVAPFSLIKKALVYAREH